MEITVKLDKREDPAKAYGLIRHGLSGFYILRSTTKNTEARLHLNLVKNLNRLIFKLKFFYQYNSVFTPIFSNTSHKLIL
jgi:hypothetical protein